MTPIFKILLAVVVVIFLLYLYVRYLERKTIFQPTKTLEHNPSEIGLNYEDVRFKTSDGVELNGWYIPDSNAIATLIFCHGNGGNIGHRLNKIQVFHRLPLNIFLFDYRGYGQSQGTPSEDGLYRDVKAAYDFIESKSVDSTKIFVYGASLGGAAATDLAGNSDVDGLILEGAFTSAPDMARVIFPIIPPFLVTTQLNNFHKISLIKIPKLILHSATDEIIPFEQGQKLFAAAPMPKQFLEISGYHNEAFYNSQAEIIPVIKSFIEQTISR